MHANARRCTKMEESNTYYCTRRRADRGSKSKANKNGKSDRIGLDRTYHGGCPGFGGTSVCAEAIEAEETATRSVKVFLKPIIVGDDRVEEFVR